MYIFISRSPQLQHIEKLWLYSQRFLRYSRRKIGDHREVPRADRLMKIYINHPQPTCFHPVKWRLEMLSRLGGVRRQRISSSSSGPPICRNKITKVCAEDG